MHWEGLICDCDFTLRWHFPDDTYLELLLLLSELSSDEEGTSNEAYASDVEGISDARTDIKGTSDVEGKSSLACAYDVEGSSLALASSCVPCSAAAAGLTVVIVTGEDVVRVLLDTVNGNVVSELGGMENVPGGSTTCRHDPLL